MAHYEAQELLCRWGTGRAYRAPFPHNDDATRSTAVAR